LKEILERRSSSPAAPPPSFCEAAYTAPTLSKSTALCEKNKLSSMSLNSNRDFQTANQTAKKRHRTGHQLTN
ncbi:hypothetical protein, partial [Rhizobium sp. AC44/96]|uniref:hypothetical protein n=1 Tax=Rhizobium sp. AC44/96 TaxID=1841654 RepID=UPI001A7E0AB3